MSSDPLVKLVGIEAMRDLARSRVAARRDVRVLRRTLKLVFDEEVDEPGPSGP